jgi:hypothetical protein
MLILIFFLLMSGSVSFADGLTDPNGILEQTDAFVGKPSFEWAFQNGDEMLLETTECIGGSHCHSMNVKIGVLLGRAGNEPTAEVTFDAGGTSFPQKQTVTQSQWLDWGGNLLRNHIKSLNSYGFQVELTSIQPSSVEVMVNQTKSRVESRKVLLIASGNQTVQEEWELTTLPGMAQAVGRLETSHLLGPTTKVQKIISVKRHGLNLMPLFRLGRN